MHIGQPLESNYTKWLLLSSLLLSSCGQVNGPWCGTDVFMNSYRYYIACRQTDKDDFFFFLFVFRLDRLGSVFENLDSVMDPNVKKKEKKKTRNVKLRLYFPGRNMRIIRLIISLNVIS